MHADSEPKQMATHRLKHKEDYPQAPLFIVGISLMTFSLHWVHFISLKLKFQGQRFKKNSSLFSKIDFF